MPANNDAFASKPPYTQKNKLAIIAHPNFIVFLNPRVKIISLCFSLLLLYALHAIKFILLALLIRIRPAHVNPDEL